MQEGENLPRAKEVVLPKVEDLAHDLGRRRPRCGARARSANPVSPRS
jgi:hypothetical protein